MLFPLSTNAFSRVNIESLSPTCGDEEDSSIHNQYFSLAFQNQLSLLAVNEFVGLLAVILSFGLKINTLFVQWLENNKTKTITQFLDLFPSQVIGMFQV